MATTYQELLSARRLQVALLCTCAMGWVGPADAYRPFDGTDAAVAGEGDVEIELQPAGVRREGGDNTLVAPATVINYGFAKDWEAIVQGQLETPLSSPGPTSLAATGAFLKHVIRPGSLQEQSGPSIATEFGLLLPGVNADSGVGASWAAIASERWDWGTLHFNLQTSLTRDQHADVFVGTIIEGPATWKLRPVAEIFYEEEFEQSHTISGLVGAIWQVRDNLSFDVGLRHALVNGHPVNEVRAGLTFGFPLRLLGSMDRK